MLHNTYQQGYVVRIDAMKISLTFNNMYLEYWINMT